MPMNTIRHVGGNKGLSPLSVLGQLLNDSNDSRCSSHPVALISSVAVSVTGVFLQNRFVSSLSNPQRGRPVDHTLSGLYPSTCLAWVAAPGNKSPASIALGVSETCKPTDCEMLAIQQLLAGIRLIPKKSTELSKRTQIVGKLQLHAAWDLTPHWGKKEKK